MGDAVGRVLALVQRTPPAYHLLTRVVVMRAVFDEIEVAILAARRFLDLAVGEPQRLRALLPGLDQHGRILRDGLVLNRVADTAQPFDDLQVFRVERAVVGQPRFFVEVDRLDDEGIALIAADRVAEVARGQILAMGVAPSSG